MTAPKVNPIALGFRWGELLSHIATARANLKLAEASADLLSHEDRKALLLALESVAVIDGNAWADYERERKAVKK